MLDDGRITAVREAWKGFRDELPILLGVIPFGMIYGVLALAAGLSPQSAQAMSVIVFAGSAQFVITQLVQGGAPMLVIILTVCVVNLRHALYSASLAPYVSHLSQFWKLILAYLLTDEAYAVTVIHFQDSDQKNRQWYFLAAGLTLWCGWQISTAVGVFLGAQLPTGWGLDFTLALTFIALVIPSLKDRAAVVSSLAGGITALAAADLPYKLGLLLAAIVGIGAGLLVEKRWTKSG
jgi:4-azaleucine resistance transporter AzlC